jgi:hypothetical protein
MTATVRRGPGTNSRLSPVNFSLATIATTLFRFSAKALGNPIDRTVQYPLTCWAHFLWISRTMLNITIVWNSSFVCYTTHQSTSRLRWVYRRAFEGDLPDSGDHYSPADSIPVRSHVDRRGLSRHIPPSRVSDNPKGMHFCYFGVTRLQHRLPPMFLTKRKL